MESVVRISSNSTFFTLLLRRRIKESFRWVKNKTKGNASNRLTRRAVYLTAILSIGLFVWTMILAVFASYLPSLLTRIYGLPPYESLIIGSIQWVMYILGCVVAFKLVDVIGRKRLIVIGTLVAMVSAVLVYLSGRNIISVITAGVLATGELMVPPTQEYRFTLSKYPQRFTGG
jgi:MFS family permease